MNNNIRLVIDNRETAVISRIKTNVEVKQLDLGDFQIVVDDVTRIIIERKTVSDFESSIKDMRYKEQKTRAMSSSNALYVMLVEGSFRFKDDTNTHKMLTGAVINSIFRDRIHFVWTTDIEDTVDFLQCCLARMLKDPNKYFDDHETSNLDDIIIKQKKKENINKKTCLKLQLSAIPGISCKKIDSILQVHSDADNIYTFCQKMSQTTPKEFFKSVKGIGKVLQDSIYSFCGVDTTCN